MWFVVDQFNFEVQILPYKTIKFQFAVSFSSSNVNQYKAIILDKIGQ